MTDGKANAGLRKLEDFERLAHQMKVQGITMDTVGTAFSESISCAANSPPNASFGPTTRRSKP